MMADFLSKEIDFEDYQVTESFFQQVCNDMSLQPEIDFFGRS